MANYYIGDPHFKHKNVIKHDFNNGCRYFESIEEHDKLIIENWNRVVGPNDNVYILGDLSWGNAKETEELLKKLNGKKILIKGNHDSYTKDPACRKQFEAIYDYKTIQDGNRMVVLFHYPILFYQNQHRNSVLLYAHVHNTREEKLFQETCERIASETDIPFNCYNVGCMTPWMDYCPRTLDEILAAHKK